MPDDTAATNSPDVPALSVRGIGRSFVGNRVLEDISFEIWAGECLMLVGENGAGKSTLKNVLSGLVHPDKGSLFFSGEERRLHSQNDARALRVATVHQELSLFPNLSVAENIFLGHEGAGLSRVPWREWRQRAKTILEEELGAHIDVDKPVGELSIGQRQLVEIAKAHSHDPRVLILDEPTTCLTIPERDKLMEVVRQLQRRGIAILYITHFMEEVYALASRIMVIRDGRIVGEGTPQSLDRKTLSHLMIGGEIDVSAADLPVVRADAEVRLEADGIGDGGLVHDISFAVCAGVIFGIAGLVGSGRSEIAEMLFGLRPLATGEIRIGGARVDIACPRDAIAHNMALVSEDRRHDQAFLVRSVAENATAANIAAIARYGWLRRSAEHEATAAMTRTYAISHSGPASAMATLSGGNQQKLIIGRWLELKPRICILDEPTKGVDIGARALIHHHIVELATRGSAVILISSDLSELLALSHRVAVMHKGRMVATVDPAAIAPAEIIEIASSGKKRAEEKAA